MFFVTPQYSRIKKKKKVDLILQIPALIGAQLLQIIRYEWNKSFPVAYTALDTR